MVDPPDAAIIALCDSLIEIEIEATALLAQWLTIADERRTEPHMIALEHRVVKGIFGLAGSSVSRDSRSAAY